MRPTSLGKHDEEPVLTAPVESREKLNRVAYFRSMDGYRKTRSKRLASCRGR
jgi:hypothetical protein